MVASVPNPLEAGADQAIGRSRMARHTCGAEELLTRGLTVERGRERENERDGCDRPNQESAMGRTW